MQRSEIETRVRPLEVLAVGSFRRFWLGFTFSGVGDGMTKTALVWYVFTRTNSPVDLGLLMLAYTGPVVVGGILAGHLLDRWDRRKVMLADSVIRGAVVVSVPVAAAFGYAPLWLVFVVAAVYGCLFMITLAGVPTVLPSLVGVAQLTAANALETLSFTIEGIAGPALGGLLIAALGAPDVLAFDAASYLAFAGVLMSVNLNREDEPSQAAAMSYRLGDAVRLLFQNRVLLSTTVMFTSFNAGLGFLQIWLPALAKLLAPGQGAELYGLLFAIMAAGEVSGVIAVTRLKTSRPEGELICIAQILAGVSLAAALTGSSAWMTAFALFACGFFSAPMTAWAQTLRMRVIPPPLRGRTFALLRTIMLSSAPVFSTVGGAVYAVIGLRALIALTATMMGAPGLLGIRIQGLAPRRRDEAPPEPPPGPARE